MSFTLMFEKKKPVLSHLKFVDVFKMQTNIWLVTQIRHRNVSSLDK